MLHKLSPEAFDFLKKNAIMVIATVDEECRPYPCTMLYCMDDDLNFHFITYESTYKSKNIAANNRVGIVIGNEHDPFNVQISGEAHKIEDEEKIDMIMGNLATEASKKKDFWPPILQVTKQDYVIYKIVPDWMRIMKVSPDSMTNHKDLYQEIDLGKK